MSVINYNKLLLEMLHWHPKHDEPCPTCKTNKNILGRIEGGENLIIIHTYIENSTANGSGPEYKTKTLGITNRANVIVIYMINSEKADENYLTEFMEIDFNLNEQQTGFLELLFDEETVAPDVKIIMKILGFIKKSGQEGSKTLKRFKEEIEGGLKSLKMEKESMEKDYEKIFSNQEKELRGLKEEVDSQRCLLVKFDRPENNCSICLQIIEQKVAIIPCGHYSFCWPCLNKEKMTNCPICKANIVNKLKLY